MTITKKITAFIFLTLLAGALGGRQWANASLLESNVTGEMDLQSQRVAASYDPNTSEMTMTEIVARVIAVFLGLLGTIFAFLMVLAGYNWLTAGGNEEKVEKAQHIIKVAIIGLIIVSAAYAISYWIFARLPD